MIEHITIALEKEKYVSILNELTNISANMCDFAQLCEPLANNEKARYLPAVAAEFAWSTGKRCVDMFNILSAADLVDPDYCPEPDAKSAGDAIWCASLSD